ncbi:hybrid sensor histidine kinase/response regulator [Desulfococcaceae bacterium HSG9]|nr:hybrid sensor histidine kinase/response regulator [Desulfococcaceae bacterium HSG9]
MQTKFKVLVVDDDPLNLNILEEIIGDIYEMASVNSGEAALEILPRFCPDLILLDIMMPGIDGYEVCRHIRDNERYKFTKIILVSGKALIAERLKGYEVGADDYVTKPFVAEEMEAKIRVFLRLKHTEEMDQIKTELLMLFSHETRTPLNGIISMSEFLQNDSSLNEKTRDHIRIITDSGYRLLDFVEKASTLCNLKYNSKLSTQKESIAIHLKSALTIVKYNLENLNKKVSLDLNIKNDAELACDWNLVMKALQFIFDNAVKYSPDNGVISIGLDTDHSCCYVCITDQGEGIPPDWINRIFDEFAIRDILHHNKGLGLSLAITRHIMELHGGEISVTSEPGQGAAFTLTFPLEANNI